MSNPVDRLEGLSPEDKRRLLKELLERKQAAAASAEPAQPTEITAPVSLAQKRLWLLAQIEPDVRAYNLLNAFRLRGPLDVPTLERAMGEVVRRHEALRTTFRLEDGEPRQIIAPPTINPVPLEVVDLTDVPEGEREGAAHTATVERAQGGYDLEAGPLYRWSLLKLGPEHHVLLMLLHHIVADNWSFGVLNAEVGRIYGDLAAGREPSLPPLATQYRQYARWEREQLAGDTLDRELAYWVDRLAGMEVTELTPDHPRPAVQSYRGAILPFDLPADLVTRLEAVRGASRATPHMLYLAAFLLLLAKLTATRDVNCGAPIANRETSDAEALIGFFVNTLVMRAKAHPDDRWPSFLAAVREACLEAYAHPHVPFDKLVEALQVERDLSRNPLYQITFQYGLLPRMAVDGVETENVYQLDYGVVRSDLEMYVLAGEGRLRGIVVYNTDLYDAASVTELAGQYRALLEAVADAPDSRLEDLSLLTAAERREVLTLGAAPIPAAELPATVPAAFRSIASEQPNSPALDFGDRGISYGELDDHSDRLAHYLRSRGVGPETPVGLCLERSPESVVGVLAVLKAGGFYVPLDPSHPTERLRGILEEIAAPLVLVADGATRERLALPESLSVTPLTDIDLAAQPTGPPPEDPTAGPDRLAYAIYTSGSTGRPKGVLVPHRAILRLVLGTEYAPLEASDRVLHASNVAFDAATWEIYGALLNGGVLVGIDKETALSVDGYVGLLRDKGITAGFLTTALFNRVADADPTAFSGLRYLLFGGEAVDPRRVRAVLDGGPPERFLHVYGPTETTTFASYHPIRRVAEGAVTVPIGGPIARTSLFVAGGVREPAPRRRPGELLIGGDGLARGYGGDPRLTAQRFVPNPFTDGDDGASPGARLYRSGDLVRWNDDGAVEFLGRIDHQVKLRGFRIELGEIETALAAQPTVAEAVAAVWEARPGDRRLIAYLVPAPGQEPRLEDLRRALKDALPDYMVPTLFALLDAFPMTAGGKIHRKALPNPKTLRTLGAETASAPPDTVEERRIAAVWKDALLSDQFGVDDNFFDLGGNSLLMVQVRQGLRESLGRDFTMIELFQYPTIRSLAEFLRHGASGESVEEGKSRGARRREAGNRGSSRRARRLAARGGEREKD